MAPIQTPEVLILARLARYQRGQSLDILDITPTVQCLDDSDRKIIIRGVRVDTRTGL